MDSSYIGIRENIYKKGPFRLKYQNNNEKIEKKKYLRTCCLLTLDKCNRM